MQAMASSLPFVLCCPGKQLHQRPLSYPYFMLKALCGFGAKLDPDGVGFVGASPCLEALVLEAQLWSDLGWFLGLKTSL